MKATKLLSGVALAAGLLIPGAAHAQIFASYDRPTDVSVSDDGGAPARAPERIVEPLPGVPGDVVSTDAKGKDEKYEEDDDCYMHCDESDCVQIGGFYSKWSSTNSLIRLRGNPGLRRLIESETEGGQLGSIEICLGRWWSVGGWYNHFNGSYNVPEIVGGFPTGNIIRFADTETQVAEVHLMRYLAHGFAIQAGWIHARQDVRPDVRGFDIRVPDFRINAMGPNLWLHNSQRVWRYGCDMGIDVFGGVGLQSIEVYELEQAGRTFEQSLRYRPRGQAIVGLSIGVAENLKLNGSVWAADINTDNLSTRVNAGVSGSF